MRFCHKMQNAMSQLLLIVIKQSLTHCILVGSSTLYVGWVHLSFSGCQVYFVTFILILMGNPVSKQCTLIRCHIIIYGI